MWDNTGIAQRRIFLNFVFSVSNPFLKAGVKTLSVRMGTKRVFWTCVCFLEVAYLGAMVTGLLSNVRLPLPLIFPWTSS